MLIFREHYYFYLQPVCVCFMCLFLGFKKKEKIEINTFLFSSAVQKEQSVHPTRPFASRIVGLQCYLQPFSLCHLSKCFLVPSFSFLRVYLKCIKAAVPFQFEYLRNRLVFSLGKHFLYYASNLTKRWSRRNLSNFPTRSFKIFEPALYYEDNVSLADLTAP